MISLKFLKEIAISAGDFIKKEKKKGLKIKEKLNRNDLVTNVDKGTEKLIIKKIKSIYPNHEILGEESSFSKNGKLKANDFGKKEYMWIIDPIDGTTNFTHGMEQYAISIAIFKKNKAEEGKNYDFLEGEIIMGIVYAPELGEMFYAEKRKGAYLEQRRGKTHEKTPKKTKLSTSKTKKVEKSLFATGFPPRAKEQNIPRFVEMMNRCRAIRRLGAASLDICYVAAGRFDGYWEFGLSPWDIAAGALIVSEAGGTVSDSNGNLLDLFGQDILATNGKIHEETVNLFKNI